jgi:bifunctional ADP-heptose synthase (sugar kinase/adenylyltransferase)
LAKQIHRSRADAKIIQAYGGSVRLISYVPGHSTTELIEAIRRLEQA